MYGWMQTESAGASNRGREREGERKRGVGVSWTAVIILHYGQVFFFSAAIIPLSGTAGQRGRTSHVWKYDGPAFLFSPQNNDAMLNIKVQ